MGLLTFRSSFVVLLKMACIYNNGVIISTREILSTKSDDRVYKRRLLNPHLPYESACRVRIWMRVAPEIKNSPVEELMFMIFFS